MDSSHGILPAHDFACEVNEIIQVQLALKITQELRNIPLISLEEVKILLVICNELLHLITVELLLHRTEQSVVLTVRKEIVVQHRTDVQLFPQQLSNTHHFVIVWH
jgi:hypothetical protein